ncbi:MAG: hypothetical protein ABL888_00675 [Pirellulaceae bacterium]
MASSWEQYRIAASTKQSAWMPRAVSIGAVAMSGLMAASDLEADIIYSGPLNTVINRGSQLNFNFDNDSLFDVNLAVIGGSFDADPLNGAIIFANLGSSNYAQKFDFNDLISSTAGSNGLGFMGWYQGGITTDAWGALQAGINATGPVTGFLGFQFNGNNGWMELSLAADNLGDPLSMTVRGWAFDNTGAPIRAGFTSVPERSFGGLLALAMLASGAIGLRRKRDEA